MAYYNINPEKRNFLQRGFVSVNGQTGQATGELNPFMLIQDPTFLTFKVEFWFPEGVNHPNGSGSGSNYSDQYLQSVVSHEGLLLPPSFNMDSSNVKPRSSTVISQNLADYNFRDSAEDYLYAIGSVDRIAALRSFKSILYKLQTETPWYFQKIGGADNLYKVDPGKNVKEENMLTFECLESVDLRTSLLADMYRAAAWDFQRHREVLPLNLRTFRMRIHVLEMRDFNRSYGAIAQLIKGDMGSQKNYEEIVRNARFQSAVSNGVRGTAIGVGTGAASNLGSAFDALSFQTYELGLCEFDFFSNSQDFLSDLTVVDPQMASFKFGVKYQTVRKTAKYSFYDFLNDYVIRKSMFPGEALTNGFTIGAVDLKSPTVIPFYDAESTNSLINPYRKEEVDKIQVRIDPNSSGQLYNSTTRKVDDQNSVRNISPNPAPRAGGILGRAIGAVESRIATAINQVESRVNQTLLGNVYDKIPSPAEASQALLGFFNPDLALSVGGERSQNIYDPGSVQFDQTNVDNTISPLTLDPLSVDNNLVQSPFSTLTVDKTITGGGLDPLSTDTTITGGGLDSLPVDTTLSGGGMIPLPTDRNISGGGLEPLSTDRNISGGGLDPLTVDNNISADKFDPLDVPKDISYITLSGSKSSSTIDTIGKLDGVSPGTEIQQSQLEGTPVESNLGADNVVSVFTTYLDVEIPQGIIESPLNQIQIDKNIQGGGLEGLVPDSSIKQIEMQSMSTSKEIVGGGMSGIIPTTEINSISLEGSSPDRDINGGGFDQMITPSEISKFSLEGGVPEKQVQGGGFDPLLSDPVISPLSLKGQPADTKISDIALSGVSPKSTIDQSPMVTSPLNTELLEDNANLSGAEVSKDLIDKNVNFEQSPKQIQISPKNVFRKS